MLPGGNHRETAANPVPMIGNPGSLCGDGIALERRAIIVAELEAVGFINSL
jgi:hypothetical protein